MKKILILLTTLILLLTCVLTACSGEGNLNDTPIQNESSDSVDVPQGNTIYSYDGLVIHVYDKLAYYRFDMRDKADDKPKESDAIFQFDTLENSDGKAKILVLNEAESIVEINYSDVLYDDNNICIGFTIMDKTLGEMKFKKDYNGRWYCGDDAETAFVYIHNLTQDGSLYQSWGEIKVSFEYVPKPNYVCEITYPNGITNEKTVLYDQTNKLYYFEGTKPELIFENLKARYKSESGLFYKYYLMGKDSYGYGIMSVSMSVASYENSVAIFEEMNKTVSYEAPVWDATGENGTIKIDEDNYTINHYEADGHVHEREMYKMLYEGLSSGQYISLQYYPENDICEIDAAFDWEANGDIYTFTFPNGLTTVRKLTQDEKGYYVLEDYEAE